MKSKIIIPPSCEIPQSYLGDLATTDVLEVQGKECKEDELNNAIAKEAEKQFGNHE